MKACFQIRVSFLLCRMAGASLRERRSQFLRDHQISPWQGLGWTKSIPRDHHGKLAFDFSELLLRFCRMAGASLRERRSQFLGIIRPARGRVWDGRSQFLGITKDYVVSFFSIHSILVATMCLQIAKLRELTKIAFSCCGIKAEVANNYFCCNLFYTRHKIQNIDQFLCQRGFYRPFIDHFLSHSRFIDHFLGY